MKRFSYAVLPFLLASLSSAQSKLSTAFLYDLSARRTITAGVYDLSLSMHDVLGVRGFTVDLLPLLGSTNALNPTLGGIVAGRLNLSREYFAEVGYGARITPGEKPHGYLFLGFGRRL